MFARPNELSPGNGGAGTGALLMAVGATVAGLELLLALALRTEALRPAMALVAHALAVAGAVVPTCWPPLRPLRGVALQLAVLTAIGGALGAAIWLVATLGTGRVHRSTPWKWIDDELVEEDGKVVRVWNDLLDGRLRIRGASRAAPLRDVLASASPATKLRALAILAHRYDPAFAGPLAMSLRDENAAVRVMGAAVLAKLQASYATRVARADVAAQRAQDVPSKVAAALEHVRYAESGLLAGDQRAERLGVARKWAEDALAREPGHEQARLVLARVLIGLRSFRKALTELQPSFTDAGCDQTARALAHRAASALGLLYTRHIGALPQIGAVS